ncbi:MAG: hypothetical protein HYS32_01105 [Candidatus Woesearchaeota archaeon]|nr:MAG: hypothetical protein HYS32_01105 [Candidatus Woesearchaeota archaeon]
MVELQHPVYVHGIGSLRGEIVVSNLSLWPLFETGFNVERARGSLDTTEGADISRLGPEQVFDFFVRRKLGVGERRYTRKTIEEMIFEAGRQAIQEAGSSDLRTQRTRAYISTTNDPRVVPNIGQIVAHELLATNTRGVHLNYACAGLMFALEQAYDDLTAGRCDGALVGAVEKSYEQANFEDPTNGPLWGSGAVAFVLSRNRDNAIALMGRPFTDSCSAPGDLIQYSRKPKEVRIMTPQGDFSFLENDVVYQMTKRDRENHARKLKGVAERMASAIKAVLGDIPLNEVHRFFTHPASLKFQEFTARALNLSKNDPRISTMIETDGNSSSAATGLALDHYWKEKGIPEGSLVVLSSIGASYNWGAVPFITLLRR